MNSKSTAILVSITLIVVVATFVVVNQRSKSVSDDPTDQYLLPNLQNKVNDIKHIELISGADKTTLSLQNSEWVVNDRNNHVANLAKIKELIFSLSNSTIVEAKTKKSENYAKLGVDDPKQQGATSTLLSISIGNNEKLAEVIVGNRRPGSSGEHEMRYIRILDEEQVWLVKTSLSFDLLPSAWLDKTLMNIPYTRVKKLVITQPDNKQLIITKDSMDDPDHIAANLPKGKELNARFEPRNIASTLENFVMDDVRAEGSVDFSKSPVTKTQIETYDGIVIATELTEIEGLQYAKFSVQFDPDIRVKETNAETSTDNPPAATPSTKLKDLDAVQKEATEIGERVKSWTYVIPKAKFDLMTKKVSDLIKQEQKAAPPH